LVIMHDAVFILGRIPFHFNVQIILMNEPTISVKRIYLNEKKLNAPHHFLHGLKVTDDFSMAMQISQSDDIVAVCVGDFERFSSSGTLQKEPHEFHEAETCSKM
jgi:hypothetical protein